MQKQPRASLALTLLSFLFIGFGYLKAAKYEYNGYNEILIIVFLTVSGTYLLFSSLVVYVGKFIKSKKSIFFRGTNIITFSNFIHKSRSNSRILATIAVLSACTITSVGAAAIYFDSVNGIDRLIPFSYVYEVKDSNLDKNIENVILKHKENKMKDSITIEVKTAEGMYPNISKLDSDNKEYEKSIDNIISVSVLNKLLKCMDKDMNVSLKNDEVICCFYNIYSEDIIETMSRSRVYNQNSYGDNALDISCYSDEYSNKISEVGFTLFLITFVGIVFLICTGSMIFFKQLAEGNDDKIRYDILKKIGTSKQEVRSSVAKQISVIFILPLIVGICHSIEAMKILKPILNSNIWPPVIGVMGIYIVIYFIYYLLTVKYYCRILDNKL